MNKEKIISVVQILNIGLAVCLAPFMFFAFLFSEIVNGDFLNPIAIQCYGYTLALVFGIAMLKKRFFIWLSLLGWIIFAMGHFSEQTSIGESTYQACIEMRQDTANCVESSDGTMNCAQGARMPGVYPMVCAGISK